MIDFHCHILPGIDDGARSMNEAVELCRIAVENNIQKSIVTPHLVHPEEVDGFIKLRDRRLDELRSELDRRKIELELFPGTEVFVNDDIFYAPKLDAATINGTKYILIEFDFRGLNINRLIKYTNEFVARGYQPIIAHPERYIYMQHDYDIVNHLADIGVLFQLNSASLAGWMGMEAKELSFAMAANGLASFIGTDAHSVAHRPTNLLEQSRSFPHSIPPEVYEELTGINAQSVLDGKEVMRADMYPIRPKRFYR